MGEARTGIFIGDEAHAQGRHVVGQRRRAQHGNGATRHRILHKACAIGLGARERREQIARLDLAAVAGEARQSRNILDTQHTGSSCFMAHYRPGMWRHYGAPEASLVGGAVLGTPRSGAMRWITRPTAGAAVQPARAKPAVSLVPCGWSSRMKTR